MPLRADTTWDGSSSSDWFDSANWSAGIPDAADNVTIPTGLGTYPVLDQNGATCRDLIINAGATLDLVTFTIDVVDDFVPGATNVLLSTATGVLNMTGNNFFFPEIQGAITFSGDVRIDRQGIFSWVTIQAAVDCDDLLVVDGIALLTTAGGTYTHTFDDVTVSTGATLDRVNATLDVGGDVSIAGTFDDTDTDGGTSVAGNWTDSGVFQIGTQTVTFDGGGTSLITVPDASDFYNLTISGNTTARVTSAIDVDNTLTIGSGSTLDADGDLDVTGGAVTCSGTGRLQIGSSVTSLGTFTAGSGTVEYDSTSANQTIQVVTYFDLEIDKSSFTATASGAFTVGGDLDVTSGTIDVASAGDVTVTGAVSVDGTMTLTNGGDLRLGTSVTINSGGTFSSSGATRPTVTNDGSGDYTFTVSSGGTIDIRALNFFNPESTGLTVNSGATISNMRNIDFQTVDPDADGSNDTFLRILDSGSTQYSFVNLSFDNSCTFNVETASGTSININMIVPSGANGTESFEKEGTVDSIDWPAFTRTWVGGTSGVENDWDEPNNWSPAVVPVSTDDCLIPNVTDDPILNTTGNVRSIYIDTGGSLTIDTANTMNFDLDLIIHASGTFTMTDGTVDFGGTGTQSIDDEGGATVTVYDLTVNKSSGTFSSNSSLTISNDLTVTAGTVAVSSHNYTVGGATDVDGTLTVSTGTLDANGSFDATGGTVTFSGAGRLQLGGAVTSLGTFTANASTVVYDDSLANRTMANVTYHHLEVSSSTRTVSAGASLTVTGSLTVNSGTFAIGTNTITVTGATDLNSFTTLSTGLLDANGPFDATGGAMTFTGAGRLQLGDAVTSLGTFTPSTGTVEYDDQSSGQTVLAVNYRNLEIDTNTQVALTGGNVTVTDDLTIVSGELEVDDGDTLRVDDDVTVTGTLDLEPGSTLLLAAATALTVTGTFEAIAVGTDLALITSSDTATPGRYSFSISAGGVISASQAYFRYMNSNGIQITDNGSVQALSLFDHIFFDNGATGGTLLSVTNNDDAVTLTELSFTDTSSDLTYNVATTSATATITIDMYSGDFGGPTNENDNGSGTVTPGFIDWGIQTTVRLASFDATALPRGVLLEWETVAEWHSTGFTLERASGSGAFAPLGPPVLHSTGVGSAGDHYRFLDDTPGAIAGTRYRLIEIDRLGGRQRVGRAVAHRATTGLSTPPAPRLATIGWPGPVTRRAGPPSGASSSPGGAATAAAVTLPAARSLGPVRIRVEPDAFVRLTHADLAAARFPVGENPARFQMRRDGSPWPIAVIGGADGRFDPGDTIDFFAPPFSDLETKYDVFVLELADPGVAPARISELLGAAPWSAALLGSSPTTIEIASQDLYVLSLEDGDGRDHFFDEVLFAPGTLDIPVELDSVVAGGEPATVAIDLEGWSADLLAPLDHSTRVLFDGVELGTLSSNGSGPYGGEFQLPTGLVTSGAHVITLEQELIALPDVVFLDRVQVTYRRAHRAQGDRLRGEVRAGYERLEGFTSEAIELYRIGGVDAPERIVGGTVSLGGAGDWSLTFHSPEAGPIEAFTGAAARGAVEIAPLTSGTTTEPRGGADWIALCPDHLRAEIEPLAALRRSQGLRTAVVSLEEVFDRYGAGRPTSRAIRAFLDDVGQRWPLPTPSFLLLVGDATYDPAGHLGPSPRQVLPASLIEAGEIQTASDVEFADLDGNGNRDLAIGRFPVATTVECRAIVLKTIAYEIGLPAGAPSTLFVSDDDSDFEGMNDAVAAQLPIGVATTLLDLASMPLALLRATLPGEWTQATVVHYTGHGGRQVFGDEGILVLADVPTLGPDPSPPVVIAMNCLNGFFQHPLTPSLGEALVLSPDGGAIAYFGPSAITSTLAQQALAEELHARLLLFPGSRIGDAIRDARTALTGTPGVEDVLATWLLLGDPALRVR